MILYGLGLFALKATNLEERLEPATKASPLQGLK